MMVYDPNTTQRDATLRSDVPISTGIPFWDMMLSFGKASQQAMTGYAARNTAAAQPSYGAVHQPTGSVEVIPVGEETLNVGTRLVTGETTRVRRVVVETPVEQSVSLREERVIVERRKPSAATAVAMQGVLTETAIEMSDSVEVAEVWKSVRVTEEVVLRREVTERRETVRDTVRHDEVVVEHVNRALPAPRLETVATQASKPVAQPVAASPQASKPEPAQLAADLKKVAERFETSTEQHDKAPRAEANPAKAEQKPATVQSSKAVAEPPKPAAARSEAGTASNDKGGTTQKH